MSEHCTSSMDFASNFKCVFCSKGMVQLSEPQLLPCLHSACKMCLKTQVDDNHSEILTCGKCKDEFSASSVIDHLFLMENITSSEEGSQSTENQKVTCTSCDDNADASSFCVDCHEWLCSVCLQAHQRVRITKDHSVQSLDEMKKKRISLAAQKCTYCPLHKQEKLKLYCESCEKLTCRDCQLQEHKDHAYQFISDACQRQKNVLNDLLIQLAKKRTFLNNSYHLVSMRQKEIEEKEKAVVGDIKNFAISSINHINHRGKLLLQELNNVTEQKKKQLSAKTEELNIYLSKLKDCQSFVEQASKEGSDIALLHCMKTVCVRLSQLIKQNCDVPNPKYKVDIRFSYDASAVSDYIKKIGCLIVDQHPVSTPNGSVPFMSVNPSSSNSSISSSTNLMAKASGDAAPIQVVRTSPDAQRPTIVRNPPGVNTSQANHVPLIGQPRIQRSGETQQFIHTKPGALIGHQIPGTEFVLLNNSAKLGKTLTGSTVRVASSTSAFPSSSSAHPTHQCNITFWPRITNVTSLQPRLPTSIPSSFSSQAPTTAVRHYIRTISPTKSVEPYPTQLFQAGASALPVSSSSSAGQNVEKRSASDNANTSLPHIVAHPFSPPPATKRLAIEVTKTSTKEKNTTQRTDDNKKSDVGPQAISENGSTKTRSNQMSSEEVMASKVDSMDSTLSVVIKQEVTEPEETEATVYQDNSKNKDTLLRGLSETSPTSPLSTKSADNTSNRKTPTRPDTPDRGNSGHSAETDNESGFSEPIEKESPPSTPTKSCGGETKKRKASNSPSPTSASKMQCRSIPIRTHRRERVVRGPLRNDSSEDWCAVCHDGGELLCCGKCPRVYHLSCHVPSLNATPKSPYSDDWVCILCRDFDTFVPQNEKEKEKEHGPSKRKQPVGLSGKELMICERILMELFCHEASYPFHHPVSRMVPNYSRVISKPMDFTTIKLKLSPTHFNHYADVEEFLTDVRLVFQNCCKFNPVSRGFQYPENSDVILLYRVGSRLYNTAELLNNFLEDMLFEFLGDFMTKKKDRRQSVTENDS